MSVSLISLTATIASIVARLGRGPKTIEILAKPLIVAPFLLSKHADPIFRLGCLAHMVGDIELMRSGRSLHRGAAFFGIGHIAFTVRLIKNGAKPRLPWFYVATVLGMSPIIKDPKFITYAAVLATYSSVADPLGGALFMVSDALIQIRSKYPHELFDAVVIASYGLAQYRLLSQ